MTAETRFLLTGQSTVSSASFLTSRIIFKASQMWRKSQDNHNLSSIMTGLSSQLRWTTGTEVSMKRKGNSNLLKITTRTTGTTISRTTDITVFSRVTGRIITDRAVISKATGKAATSRNSTREKKISPATRRTITDQAKLNRSSIRERRTTTGKSPILSHLPELTPPTIPQLPLQV